MGNLGKDKARKCIEQHLFKVNSSRSSSAAAFPTGTWEQPSGAALLLAWKLHIIWIRGRSVNDQQHGSGDRVDEESEGDGGEDRYSHLDSIESGVRERERVEQLLAPVDRAIFRVPNIPSFRPTRPVRSRPIGPTPFRPRAASASATNHVDKAMEHLRRKRQRLDEDMKEIGVMLVKYENQGTDRYRLDLLEKDIVAANILVEEVMSAFDKVLEVANTVRAEGIGRDRDRMFRLNEVVEGG